jgi:rod shape-determining protein MreD
MSDFSSGGLSAGFADPSRQSRIPKAARVTRAQVATLAGISLAAIMFQVYVPRFLTFLAYLELPLLVTVYFSLMRRSPVIGILLGASIGLVQDALTPHQPLGMFGIVKTLVGFFAASFSQRFDLDHSAVRLILSFFFFFFHQFFYWVLDRALLGANLSFSPGQTLVLAILNSVVAVPLFRVLDRLHLG